MSDIQQLIELLKSENPKKRYDACQKLRKLPELPQEALGALRQAIDDAVPSVSEAAQRAIAFHALKSNGNDALENGNWLTIGLLAGLIPGLTVSFTIGMWISYIIVPVAILGGMIGAAIGNVIGKQNMYVVLLGAIAGGVFGSILGFAFFGQI